MVFIVALKWSGHVHLQAEGAPGKGMNTTLHITLSPSLWLVTWHSLTAWEAPEFHTNSDPLNEAVNLSYFPYYL